MKDLVKTQKSCQNARGLMKRSREEGFAVGAFNIDNQETLIGIIKAAKKLNSPVLIEASKTEVNFMGLNNIRSMVDNYIDEYGIELYLNLDHSPSIEDAKKGIDAGFEFIHIDISQSNHEASDDEIINSTREVVEYAKKTGALVESEPHYFWGSSNIHSEAFDYEEIKKEFSTPENAKLFVGETGIDTFAAAIGNLHGKYPIPKKLDLELLKKIRNTIDCNISLHGGSGTPLELFEEAAKIGVSKININSDLRFAYRNTLEKQLNENPDEYAILKILDPVVQSIQDVVEEKIQAFGSSNKSSL